MTLCLLNLFHTPFFLLLQLKKVVLLKVCAQYHDFVGSNFKYCGAMTLQSPWVPRYIFHSKCPYYGSRVGRPQIEPNTPSATDMFYHNER